MNSPPVSPRPRSSSASRSTGRAPKPTSSSPSKTKARSTVNTALLDRYQRSDDFEARAEGLQLSPVIWSVFARLDQPRQAQEIATLLQLDVEAASAALRRRLRLKLIRKHLLNWRDYAATQPAPAPAIAAPAEPVIVAAPAAARPAPAIPTPGTVALARPSASNPVISIKITSTAPRPLPAISLRLGRQQPPTVSGWKLRPVLDAISARSGGGIAGQLLVYRVFLQIPTELMHAAGIHSLSLVDDGFTLSHHPFRAALIAAAQRCASVDVSPLLAL